ncbi:MULTISPECIES: SigE family RNA polymerase sigma factor [Pimelobacter]|uniref:SigE family RNA polymerase sigma factor n=1 Tax=Pimelobacter TaxID=2044 RepID=UPI001C05E289|nr:MULTISPECIES: SigE family RNA polymerase sigma factor [Pimelobacter]MBU2695617.1 SigE family RNA polymerase sigma factor [Pimelobacter sp. 30-1]UUW90961.1 SigE family RNA polymerase sigma factor [Pimelobacter simplex]UUW94790.1 SigE family RNA polymerase sigma factor [Pimelobacter simplex]
MSRDTEFTAFVEEHQVRLRRIAYAVCGDWNRAEDVLQTALAKLYVSWPRLHRAGNEVAYVRRIIVNADVDDRRRPWRRERPGLDGHDPAARTGMAPEERTDLLAAVRALPPLQRRVVVLRHWLGLSVAETAAELRIAEGTVKSQSSRALATLREQITGNRVG